MWRNAEVSKQIAAMDAALSEDSRSDLIGSKETCYGGLGPSGNSSLCTRQTAYLSFIEYSIEERPIIIGHEPNYYMPVPVAPIYDDFASWGDYSAALESYYTAREAYRGGEIAGEPIYGEGVTKVLVTPRDYKLTVEADLADPPVGKEFGEVQISDKLFPENLTGENFTSMNNKDWIIDGISESKQGTKGNELQEEVAANLVNGDWVAPDGLTINEHLEKGELPYVIFYSARTCGGLAGALTGCFIALPY